MVDSHICILQERFNLSSQAKHWAMPRKEVCSCQRVVAPKMLTSQSCLTHNNEDALEDLWLVDDPNLITLLTNRRNWTPAKLDNLLEQSNCCKFLTAVVYLQSFLYRKYWERFLRTLSDFLLHQNSAKLSIKVSPTQGMGSCYFNYKKVNITI